jgi:DNA-binding response OmpR family regulator
MVKILVLEDDKLFNETLEDFLEEEGFSVEVALDPYTALELTYEYKFDLYLFDINLPYENGFKLLKRLRDSGDKTPTIFLTSREDRESLLEGFNIGADDYMRKPIDLDELLVRVKAILKREFKSDKIYIDKYMIDCNAKRVYLDNIPLPVTTKAVELLLLLISAKGEVVPIDVIEDRLWHVSENISLGSIRVYINNLKRYFPNIINIRGIGYKFD